LLKKQRKTLGGYFFLPHPVVTVLCIFVSLPTTIVLVNKDYHKKSQSYGASQGRI